MATYTVTVPDDLEPALQDEVNRRKRAEPELNIDATGLIWTWVEPFILAVQREQLDRAWEQRQRAYERADPSTRATVDDALNVG